ncbi:MAG TPA: hypothetical protein VNS52_13135 [Gemmatimonadaceae bacterium]|nr:hypothetical protein [Gemmatimonadaceae bacterium]
MRSRLRSLGNVWAIVLVVEGFLYWLLAVALSQPDLFPTPALLVLVGAAFATWRVARPRHGPAERRGADRRQAGSRRDDDAAVAAPPRPAADDSAPPPPPPRA